VSTVGTVHVPSTAVKVFSLDVDCAYPDQFGVPTTTGPAAKGRPRKIRGADGALRTVGRGASRRCLLR
jgi:hypothetical protein